MSETSPLLQKVEELHQAFGQAAQVLEKDVSANDVEQARIDWLGRKGKITQLMESLRTCTKEERPSAGKAINEFKKSVEAKIETLKGLAEEQTLMARLQAEPADVSLPVGNMMPQGALHPVTIMRQILQREFRHLGFTVYDGPEVDHQHYNFNALNIPDFHPARDMQDTFHVDGLDRTVLRTHTSNIQIHCMQNEKPPLRVVALGRVYRCDSDPTHTLMFHQVEGFVVEKGISFAHLKGVMETFLRAIYGKQMKTRFRPSYFPFVEPGAEMDIQCASCKGKGCNLCKHTGWIEIGGCGMIHPNVFENVEYDSEIYTGFAFGFGIDRMAMAKFGLSDLRTLFEGNRDFLSQFPGLS